MIHIIYILLLIVTNLLILWLVRRRPRKEKKMKTESRMPEKPVPVSLLPVAEIEPGDRPIVLIVEPDAKLCDAVLAALSTEYRTHAVSDGRHAHTLAGILYPEIIITDVSLPDMSSDDLCQLLQASMDTSHIPVIYMTTPLDVPALRFRLRNILQKRQQVHEKIRLMAVEDNAVRTEYNALDRQFMNRVSSIIHANMTDPDFSIAWFCRELAMSRTAAYNKIKSLTGLSPHEYINSVRMYKAKELLASGTISIAEVAAMVGFSDPKYFSSCFKKAFGINPSKYGQVTEQTDN